MLGEAAVEVLFPALVGVRVDELSWLDGLLRIVARVVTDEGACPGCGVVSGKVHGAYWRELADLPVSERRARIVLRMPRFRCTNPGCPRRTFSVQVEGLTCRYSRRTQSLQRMLEAVAVFLGGRPAARLAVRLAAPVSRSTLLRMLRAVPVPPREAVDQVGIDDFALRRGHVYGTVVVDMRTHHPIDVLPDRTSETVAQWLAAHPDITLICRDRAGAYADAARTGAPDAVQVADRWHLWHNLTETVEKIVRRHHTALTEPAEPVAGHDDDHDQDGVVPPVAQRRLAQRTLARYQAVHALLDAGANQSRISRELGLDRHTVRRFARASTVEELLVTAGSRTGVLDPFKPYLDQRWAAGATNACTLTTEITAQGYRGGVRTVGRYLQSFRTPPPPPPDHPPAPAGGQATVRRATGWLTRRPENLSENDTATLAKITARCPALAVTGELVREFATMLTQRRGQRLPAWLTRVQADGEPELQAFAKSLRRDLAAVTAGLTLPHSSGAVEGNVTRVKAIKRQMYGRANFDLLRHRVLLTA